MSSTTRRALLTGASSETGLAIAQALVAAGVAVHGTARSDAPATDSFAAWTAGDLASAEFRATLVAAAGPVDIFVHAAGHRFDYQRFHLQPTTDAAATWQVEYAAFDDLARQLLPGMMARRHGRIVVITSLAARVAGPGAATYGAAKAACEGLVRGLACDYGRFRVTANAVAPGPIDNARLRARLPDAAALDALAKRSALKRLVTPADVAATVAFLCSDGASAITGQTLTVACGLDLLGQW
jgi:NAD(P)-dependent dehydrogenase (short-subunit alcohol dehydrogenase family)